VAVEVEHVEAGLLGGDGDRQVGRRQPVRSVRAAARELAYGRQDAALHGAVDGDLSSPSNVRSTVAISASPAASRVSS
jgi:hypothetical protein